MEANLSATTVVTPAKCALGNWPTYTHYCWRTENKRESTSPLPSSCLVYRAHVKLPLQTIYLTDDFWNISKHNGKCSEIQGHLLKGCGKQFRISFILEGYTACYCIVTLLWVQHVCVSQSSGQFCAFTSPCCEGGTISDSTLCPLPSRHSFHPTWQYLPLLCLSPHFSLLPLSLSFYLIDLSFYLFILFIFILHIAALCSLFFFFPLPSIHPFLFVALCGYCSAKHCLVGSRAMPHQQIALGDDHKEEQDLGGRRIRWFQGSSSVQIL